MSTKAPEPRDPRESVLLIATVISGEVEPARYRISNLSERGACLAQAGELVPGTKVSITIGVVENVPAEVMWVRGDLAGLRFDHAVDLQAARKRKPVGAVPPPSAGWAAELRNAYRK